jgi:hypothetical protein
VEISNVVVARFQDGRVVKGITNDFSPNRPLFHVDPQDGAKAVEIRTRQLKALFFVASLQGNRERQDARGFIAGPAETPQGKKIAVRFRDGELLCGYTLTWTPERDGFFMFPADSGTNNQRIFVITAATLEIKAGPAADVLAQKVLSGEIAKNSPKGAGRRPIVPAPWTPRRPEGKEPERPTGTD